MTRPLYILGLFFALSPRLWGQTGPLQTEEATTAGAGQVVVETAGAFMAEEPNLVTGAPRTRLEGPMLRLVYAPASSVEIDAEWVTLVWTPHDPDFGSAKDWGDVTLRSKARLYGDGERRPALAARFSVTLPETSYGQGLGPNVLRTSMEGLATGSIRRFRWDVNAGLEIQDEAAHPRRQRDFLRFGAAGEWRGWRAVSLVTEVAGRVGHGAPGEASHVEARLGLRVGTGKLRAYAALRRGLAPEDGTWGTILGLTWWPSPWRIASRT